MQDLYGLVGVPRDADAEAIAAACEQRLAATQDHNTKVALRHAREVLCNPVSRTAYDSKLRAGDTPSRAPAIVMSDTPPSRGKFILLAGACILVSALAWTYAKKSKPALKQALAPAAPQVITRVPPTAGIAAANTVQPTAAPLGPERVYEMAAPSVAVIESLDGDGRPFARGSGVVIGPQKVLTNCHVIQRAVTVRVRMGSAEYSANSGVSDNYLDLCALLVPSLEAPEVKRASVKDVRVGQTVYAIGAPQGLDRTLSQGLVSALRDTNEGTVIQTSAAISPGSSGGGLFDAEGRLVGITTFQTKLGQNLNFALPADWIDIIQTR